MREILLKIDRNSNFSQQLGEILLKSEWNSSKNYGDILKIESNFLKNCVKFFENLSEVLLKITRIFFENCVKFY